MRRIIYALAIYAAAFSVPFVLENAAELADYLPQSMRSGLEAVGTTYQRWSNGPRARQTRYTAVVTLSQKNFPILKEACKQRALVGQLLPMLVQAGASEIVLDLAFTRSYCPDTETEHATACLKAEILNAAIQVPVLIGQASWVWGELDEKEAARLRLQGFQESAVLLKPLIDLPLQDSQYQLSTGLIQLNQDLRKVPLSWTAYEEQGNKLVRLSPTKTLSFAAARAYRAAFPDGTAELDALEAQGRHPLTSLLPKDKFIEASAAELMCQSPAAGTYEACPGAPSVSVKRKLNGKVVLLGWADNPDDIHATPAGHQPGVYLQANFIESLLDSRYLRVISRSWQLILSAIWFGFIELAFLIYRDSLQKALAGATLVFIVGAFLFYYVAVVNLGFYLALLPPSLLAVLLRCWYQWSHMKETSKEQETHRPDVPDLRSRRTGNAQPEIGVQPVGGGPLEKVG
jgi:hypothetical protein